ncbi:MAG: hypothetical protein ACR2F2_13740 [Pyrinomonadaceae bacterium]
MKKHFTNSYTKTFLTSAFVLIFGGLMMSACSASEKGSISNETTVNGTAQNAAENNQSNKTETPKTEKQTDIFAAFKKDDDYKTVVRPKILIDGWQPERSEDGYANCEYETPICKEYPELEAGPAARSGNIVFRWKKGDKILLVYTLGDPPVFEKYEFEKSFRQTTESEVLGKYECCEIGISGERFLELKAKNVAVFNERDEGSTATGNGSWSWDAKKEFINVDLTVKWKFDDGGKIETKTAKVTFQLEKDGKDLKIVRETLSTPNSSGYYIGKTFKKQK